MKEISVQELKQMMDENADFQLIDVRGDDERQFCNIGGDHIPMDKISQNIDKVKKDKKVIVQCRSGARSARVAQFLMGQGFDNIYNLKGGILAWADEIDPSVPKY